MTAGADLPTLSQPNAAEATVAASITVAVERLQAVTSTPRLEAELLLAHVLGSSRAHLYTYPERVLRSRELSAYQSLLGRRALGEPLPYVTGCCEFHSLDFSVDRRVLIPRPETEILVELALTFISHSSSRLLRPVIVDVGTGSGCLAVTLAVHAPDARIYAVDTSADALDVARANARDHRASEDTIFLESDLLEALPEPADLIVANPPYIASGEWLTLPREIREHEPHQALYGGTDGLEVIRRLLSQIPAHLNPAGAVFIEIGASQGQAATRLARYVFPSASVAIHPDPAGRDRVLCIRT